MAHGHYDIVIAGGGLGGATLGRALATQGIRTLVIEREVVFKDRVRGEGMHPWGVTEACALGIDGLLRDSGAHEVRWWKRYLGPVPRDCRDLPETTPAHSGCLDFHHPTMQRKLLDAAEAAGAVVRRGTAVVGVEPGNAPVVQLRSGHGTERVSARLVVGAEGRRSMVRRSAGFILRQDPARLVVAGVLHEGLGAPDDAVHYFQNPSCGQGALIFPLGSQRFRSYFVSGVEQRRCPISGSEHIGEFVDACVQTGAPRDWYAGATLAGPLAAYPGADSWVDHPYRDGVVLIGDAAAASDPSWGCGLSLTLRDVRVLRDCLLGTDDWDAAAHAYAEQHDTYYGALHRVEDWLTRLLYETGPIADARRAHVLPHLAKEPARAPDISGLGPDTPSDEAARRRFFAEDIDLVTR
ncbi:FAD-dependent monooxygenase [Paraburkholderia sp. BL10I2N1]|uniref:FAD-dependent oxidoreductase n=1 Tax=Paraburkholderia sp. BL10I2N1 TaxID=1938796 RepID=UPI00105E8F09|nr:FAD-dependent monooxygenase [Paraburkholderia sp. BL10I2N1]TDN63327.1 2-polyprenyl-6-methoxyphenol hydroxylase-like FAD-dependent oxidoreductase [Paraburkholderia sp. BL10I2N1]